jgi:hypothetical protein
LEGLVGDIARREETLFFLSNVRGEHEVLFLLFTISVLDKTKARSQC